MVLFFASDLASFVNGEIGDCDGGIVLTGNTPRRLFGDGSCDSGPSPSF